MIQEEGMRMCTHLMKKRSMECHVNGTNCNIRLILRNVYYVLLKQNPEHTYLSKNSYDLCACQWPWLRYITRSQKYIHVSRFRFFGQMSVRIYTYMCQAGEARFNHFLKGQQCKADAIWLSDHYQHQHHYYNPHSISIVSNAEVTRYDSSAYLLYQSHTHTKTLEGW